MCENKFVYKYCKNDCNSNGLCINGKCECHPNYEGESCENMIDKTVD